GRKVGASVVLVDGELVLYLERGGRSLLSFTESGPALDAAAAELAAQAREGVLGRFTVRRADGTDALAASGPVARSLAGAGFIATPQGLRVGAHSASRQPIARGQGAGA